MAASLLGLQRLSGTGGGKEGEEDEESSFPQLPQTQHQTCSPLLVTGQLQSRLSGQSHRVREGGVGWGVGGWVSAIGWPRTLPSYKLRMIDHWCEFL